MATRASSHITYRVNLIVIANGTPGGDLKMTEIELNELQEVEKFCKDNYRDVTLL